MECSMRRSGCILSRWWSCQRQCGQGRVENLAGRAVSNTMALMVRTPLAPFSSRWDLRTFIYGVSSAQMSRTTSRSYSSTSSSNSSRNALPLSRFLELFNRISLTPREENDLYGVDKMFKSCKGTVEMEMHALMRRSIESGNKERRFYSAALGHICRFHGRNKTGRNSDLTQQHISKRKSLSDSKEPTVYSSKQSRFFEKAVVFLESLHHEGIHPDVHMYTQLVSTLCRQGNVRFALSVIEMMQRHDITPNEFTFTCVVAACGRQGNLRKAKELLSQMKVDGMTPDVVTYTALIQAHAKQGDIQGCLDLFSTMENEGVRPNVVTFTSLIVAYTNANMIQEASNLFDNMVSKHGVRPNTFTYIHMMSAYGKARNVEMVLKIFQEMKERSKDPRFDVSVNNVVYGNVLKALIEGNDLEEAERLLLDMCTLGKKKALNDACMRQIDGDSVPSANAISFTILCDAYGRLGRSDKIEYLISIMQELGIQADVVTYSTLVRAYCKQKDLDSAMEVINRMKTVAAEGNKFSQDSSKIVPVYPNQLTYNIILNTLSEMGRPDEAEGIVRMMSRDGVKPDVITYNTIVGAYSNVGMFVKARAVIEEMLHSGIIPDVATFATLMVAYCRWDMFEDATQLIELMEDHYRTTPTRFIYTLLINELRSKGRYSLAITEFYKMTLAGIEPDIWIYNMLIDCYSKLGSIEDIYGVIERMAKNGVSPNHVTLNSLIGCIVSGFIELSGRDSFSKSKTPTSSKTLDCSCCETAWDTVQQFSTKYGIKPDATTFNYILTCFGKGGNIESGKKVISSLNELIQQERSTAAFDQNAVKKLRPKYKQERSVSDLNTRNIISKYYGNEAFCKLTIE